MEHYRCVKCYLPLTNQVHNCDTVTFITYEYPFLEVKLDDFLKQAANDIITHLSAPPSTTANFLEAGDPTRKSILKISNTIKIFKSLPPKVEFSDTQYHFQG